MALLLGMYSTFFSLQLWSVICLLITERDVGIEGNSGSDGKGEWSEMVQACIEEGWWACSEKSVGVWSEGQEEAGTTKEDIEDTSREGE